MGTPAPTKTVPQQGQSTTTSAPTSTPEGFADPGTHVFKLHRKFNWCFTNSAKVPDLSTLGVIKHNWFYIPYTNQKYYWTPRQIYRAKLFDLIKVTNINFKVSNFFVTWDRAKLTTAGVEMDAVPTREPAIWFYADQNLRMPYLKTDEMANHGRWPPRCNYYQYEDRENNTTLQLAKFQNGYTNSTPVKTHELNKQYFIHDVSIEEFDDYISIKPEGSVGHNEDIDMPWLATNTNFDVRRDKTDRKPGTWNFPSVDSASTMLTDDQYEGWCHRAIGGWRTTLQTDWMDKPWGKELPVCLIKGYPVVNHKDEPVPYTIWADFEFNATVLCRDSGRQYQDISQIPSAVRAKITKISGLDVFGTGRKVDLDINSIEQGVTKSS